MSNQTKIPQRQIDNNGGWSDYTGTMPTFTSTASGVDTISFAGIDVTGDYQDGEWAKVTSTAGTKIYKIYSYAFSTDTTMTLIGETSITGTITAISFSKMCSPQGAKPWESRFRYYAYRNASLWASDAIERSLVPDTTYHDPNGLNASGGSYVIPVTGWYLFTANFNLLGNVTYISANIREGGTSKLVANYTEAASDTGGRSITFTAARYCARGLSMDCSVRHDSAGFGMGLDVGAFSKNFFQVTYLGL